MNSEPKAFASLSSGLLARKGAARPAMRPQGFGQAGAGLDDLGWNDMGYESPKPIDAAEGDSEEAAVQPLRNPLSGLSPVPSPVHDQQASIEDRYSFGDDEEGEDADGDYVDETAELFDPESEEEGAVSAGLSPVAKAKRQPIISHTTDEADEGDETLDWKEEAFAPVEAAAPAIMPLPSPVIDAPQPVSTSKRAPKKRAAPGSKAKAAFTLRLDGERHLKLRLACAVDGRSAQQLVTEALDRLLADMPELNAMAERAAKKSAA